MKPFTRRLLACALQTFVLLPTLLLVGCASVKHASDLRRFQQEFNALTTKANEESFHFMEHDGTAVLKASIVTARERSDLGQKFSVPESYYTNWIEYAALAVDLRDLNKKAKRELLADRLYANARVLEVLVMKQRALYEGIVLAANRPVGTNLPPDRVTQNDVRDLAARVRTELAQAGTNVPVFPRNQFVLAAMEPLLQYDNALILAIRAYYAGRLQKGGDDAGLSVVQGIVQQIMSAEEKLQRMKLSENFEQVQAYGLLTRVMMLNNALLIIQSYSGLSPGHGSAQDLQLKELIAKSFTEYEKAYERLNQELSKPESTRLLGPLLNTPDFLFRPWS
jgi:hypothetical protein